jgi:glycosyltransferase involved in cell wall biosynthesis
MKITWSVPARGEPLESSRGDMVRARHLIEALRASGHEVVTVEDFAADDARRRVEAYRRWRGAVPGFIALTARDVGRRLHARAHAERVAAAARRQGADLIVETQVHFSDSGARAARATGIPLVIDDCSPLSEEIALGCGLPALARHAFASQARAAQALVVSSERLRQLMLLDGVPADRVRIGPNAAVPAPDVPAPDDERDGLRRELGLGDRVGLVFAGSFQTWHRAELLVEAAARLPDDIPLHIVLLGDGPGRAAALATAQRLSLTHRLTAPGAVPAERIPAYLSACDVGVLPGSNDYGQPMKLVEYAMAGLPAIAPDLPPVREVLKDGDTGLLFRDRDSSQMSQRILRLIVDTELRQRLGRSAREQALRTWSWEATARVLVGEAA